MKNRIVELREKAGLSQAELARRIGTTRQQMGRLERGERKVTPDWALRIAPHVSCSPQDLIVWSEAAETSSQVFAQEQAEVGEDVPEPGAIERKKQTGPTLDAFAFSLTDNEIVTAPAVASALGVSLHNLGGLIGVPLQLLESDSASAKLEVDYALRPVLGVLAMARGLTRDDKRTAIWFKHEPIPGWAGKTAYDLVSEGGADKVLAYLEAVRSGGYA